MIINKKIKSTTLHPFFEKKRTKRAFLTQLQVQASFDKSQNTQLVESRTFLPKKPVSTIFFNACFDKNHLKKVIAWFLESYGEKMTVDLVETLKQVGFHQATLAGVSLGVDDLQIPPSKAPLLSKASAKMVEVTQALKTGNVTSVEKSQRLIDTWNQTSERLRQAAVHNFKITNPVNPVYMMAFSGARGNISQVRQLVAMRGLMADPQGAILEFPIQSNFREGLTVTEYLISCYGARKGLVDTALRTATAGYLTRRLVDAVQHVVIHVTNCQTKKGIVIKDKKLEQRLIGRVLLEDVVLDSTTVIKKNTLITLRLAKKIAAKHLQILVRSPLTCQTEKSVCQLCYGLDLAQGKLVSIGEAVGIIAAQSIGEPGTQLTMRTFHTGGVGVFSAQAMKSFTAPFAGKVEFMGSLPGFFVRTPHGNIVYLLKHKGIDQDQILLRVCPLPQNVVLGTGKGSHTTKKVKSYEIKQGEIPSGSLLWVKQGEFVKTGQLLLQASRLQTARQEMPESSHPVQAPLSGEIFFEYIKSRTIEEHKVFNPTPKNKKQKIKQKERSPQINQKDSSPVIPFLLKLGKIWVFSSFVQKEAQISSSFLVKGDFVSPETPIHQYNLRVPYKGQLKQVKNLLVLAQTLFECFFSKIYYSGVFYFLMTPEKNKSVLAYTTNFKFTKLTWYPFFINLPSGSSSFSREGGKKQSLFNKINFLEQEKQGKGYYFKLGFESNFLSSKSLELNEKGIQKGDTFNHTPLRFLWSSNQVFNFLPESFFQKHCFGTSCCFVLTQENTKFSRKGFFQIKNNTGVVWLKENKFQSFFITNFSKNNRSFFFSTKKREKQSFLEIFQYNKTETGTSPQNEILGIGCTQPSSFFLKKALKTAQNKLDVKISTKFIQKEQGWFFIPETPVSRNVQSQLIKVILEPGKIFENFSFPQSYITVNLLFKEDICVIKPTIKIGRPVFSYSVKELLLSRKLFADHRSDTLPQNEILGKSSSLKKSTKSLSFSRVDSNVFSFSKKQQTSKLTKIKTKNIYKFRIFSFGMKTKRALSHVLFLQKNSCQILPEKKFLYDTWILQTKPQFDFSVRSPLFTKQNKTAFEKNQNQKLCFQTFMPSSGWMSMATFFKVDIEFRSQNPTEKVEEFQKTVFLSKTNKVVTKKSLVTQFDTNHYYKIFSPGLSVIFYRRLIFHNIKNYRFRTFLDGWVLPDCIVTRAFLKSKKLGEFRRIQTKNKRSCVTILRSEDLVTLALPKAQTSLKIAPWFDRRGGANIRWGQEIVPGFASSLSGQIIKITPIGLTLRKGFPLLASIRGLLHVTQGDLVEKNELLVTLRSRRLQTEDIVQGIPKIEQLFEARETQGGELIKNNMHVLLSRFFNLARQVKPISEAVELSLTYIQKFLVENILQAYSNQGVQIAEKHVEVVVRQMTARVRITHGGESGLLPGEFVQLRLIEKINFGLVSRGRRQASYEPVILGITKSVLQSESFLLAASFQQVSKVLVRSALAKKTDFLQGLHENILVGQPIPAGTGVIDLTLSAHSLNPESLDPAASDSLKKLVVSNKKNKDKNQNLF